MSTPFIVGIGGSTRAGSTSERALRVALSEVERRGGTVDLLCCKDVDLPMYAPEISVRSPKAIRLVDTLRRADGVIIASPGYHGGISGLVKNALDYTEDMREDARPYLEGRAVGCIVTAAGWQATTTTLMALRSVVHALRGWPTPLGVTLNSSDRLFGEDGDCLSDEKAAQLSVVGEEVLEFALARTATRRAGIE